MYKKVVDNNISYDKIIVVLNTYYYFKVEELII